MAAPRALTKQGISLCVEVISKSGKGAKAPQSPFHFHLEECLYSILNTHGIDQLTTVFPLRGYV